MYKKGFKFIYINGKDLIGNKRKKKKNSKFIRYAPIYKYKKGNFNGRIYIHTGNIDKENSGCIISSSNDARTFMAF